MPDRNLLAQLAAVTFKDANVEKIFGAFENPLRQLAQIALLHGEGLFTALVASRGRAEDLPVALMRFGVERLDDPVVLLRMLLNLPLAKAG